MSSTSFQAVEQKPEKSSSKPRVLTIKQIDKDLKNDLKSAEEVLRIASRNWAHSRRRKIVTSASFFLLMEVQKTLGYSKIIADDLERKPQIEELIDLAGGILDVLGRDKCPKKDLKDKELEQDYFPELGEDLYQKFRKGLNLIHNGKLDKAKIIFSELPRSLSRYVPSPELENLALRVIRDFANSSDSRNELFGTFLQNVFESLTKVARKAEADKVFPRFSTETKQAAKNLERFYGFLNIKENKELTVHQRRFLKIYNLMHGVLECPEDPTDISKSVLSYYKAAFEIIAAYRLLAEDKVLKANISHQKFSMPDLKTELLVEGEIKKPSRLGLFRKLLVKSKKGTRPPDSGRHQRQASQN